jgi:Family of unknown function (DUF6701)/Bacterial Ig-like domain (group 1)/Domain of unknown function DUF11
MRRRSAPRFLLLSVAATAAMFFAASAWGAVTVSKTFSPASITTGQKATLTITISNNPPPGNPSPIAFTDSYPAGLTNAAAPNLINTCGGTATAGGAALSLGDGTLTGNNACSVSVTVQACAIGSYANSVTVSTSGGGSPSGSATLTVTAGAASAATSTVAASPSSVPADGTSTSTITVTLRDSCGNPVSAKSVSVSAGSGSSSITTVSGTTNASGIATFTVRDAVAETVTYSATDTTDSVDVTQTATVTFMAAPVVSKSFTPSTIATNGTSTLAVTLTNPNPVPIVGTAFTDSYPANLKNATTPGVSNACGGTATAAPDGTSLALSGAVVPAGGACTVSVSVTSSIAGSYVNSTGAVVSTNAGNGASASATLTVGAVVAGFNAVEPSADPVTGSLFTKIAAQDFSLDIVALDASNSLATGFTGTVSIEIVDNTGGGACASLPLIASFTNQTFVSGDNGRHALTAPNTVADVWRNAKVRIGYPAGSPTVVACSGDNFAIRPARLDVVVTDADRTAAGTARVLNNVTIPGGTVHNAGRPLLITATAYNAAATPIVTTNYDGAPTAALTQCAGSACPASPTAANLSIGTWSASGGVVTTATASYSDIGAFQLQLRDDTFAAVDSGDGTPAAQLTVVSTPIDVGRFVPDRFSLSATSVTPRSDVAGCGVSTFTYMGEPMALNFTLAAVDAAGATMTRYQGALAHNNATAFNFGAVDSAAPTPLTARLDTSAVPAPIWSAGVLAGFVAPVAIARGASPDGPYAALRVGIAPVDPDAVGLAQAALDLDTDNDTVVDRAQVGPMTAARFGRLALQNAYGSELLPLQMPMRAQYYAGANGFITNIADSCTSVSLAAITLTSAVETRTADTPIKVKNGVTTQAALAHSPFSSGDAGFSFSAPGVGGDGYVDVNADAATPSWLKFDWDNNATTPDTGPTGRVTFGIYRGSPRNIYLRERY